MVTPLDTAYHRIDEAHRAWHQALAGYHRIEDFRANINSAIQALRNFTFALQKQKNVLPNFEPWYLAWQTKMRNNPILRELHEARNIIVKEEDLKLYSVATARIKGWIDFKKIEFTFDPAKDSHEVARGFFETYVAIEPISEDIKRRLVFEFERRWVYEKLPDLELLDALAQSIRFFSEMLDDASGTFSLAASVEKQTRTTFCEGALNEKGELKCLVLGVEERSITFSVSNGKLLTPKAAVLHRDELDLKEAEDRYGELWKSKDITNLVNGVFPTEFPFGEMRALTQVAIANLKKDGYLIPVSFLFSKKEILPDIIVHPFQDQEEKILSINKVASEIKKQRASYVLTLVEAWQYDPQKLKGKVPTESDAKHAQEQFHATCLSAEKVKIITIPFRRNLFRNLIFSSPIVNDFSTTDDHHVYILLPLIRALREVAS